MITEDRLREIILKGIDTTKRVGSFILFKVLHIKAALLITILWGITYILVYFISGKDSSTAIYTDFIFFLYPIWVIYKNSVGFYRWLYQK